MAYDRRHRTAREQAPELPREVMELLLEAPLRGRFEPAWRSGLYAARVPYWYLKLLLGVKSRDEKPITKHETETIVRMGLIWFKLHARSHIVGEVYREAGELLVDAEATYYQSIIYSFARIVQLFLSNSHGGGSSYNELLERLQIETSALDEPLFEEAVKEARCLDALGTDFMLHNEPFDEVRHAFLALWQGGHYRLIYSLPTTEDFRS